MTGAHEDRFKSPRSLGDESGTLIATSDPMRRSQLKRRVLEAGAVILCLASTGCSAVLEEVGRGAAKVAVAAAAEIVAAAASGATEEGANTSANQLALTGGVAPDPLADRHWDDPQNWIAECDGPMLCGDQEKFSCAGPPDDCYCECVANLAVSSSPHD